MRYSPIATCIALFALSFAPVASAEEGASLQARMAARRDLERAKTDLRFYWQVEYPRQRRELDAAIQLTRLEIEDNERLLREYRPFTHFSIGNPFPITIRELRACIVAGQIRLNDLLAEHNALVRFHSDDFRALEAQVYEARLRVLELEPTEETALPQEELPPRRL